MGYHVVDPELIALDLTQKLLAARRPPAASIEQARLTSTHKYSQVLTRV
jgi:hypothetical protein